jgi:PPOX class probable F420-dependent enzyme
MMDDGTMRARMAAARVGHLATADGRGRPHVVPCCFALDGDRWWSAVDAKPKSTLALRRLANVRANPHASVVVDHYDEDWSRLWWVRVDGRAEVLDVGAADGDRDHALALLAAKYEQYRRDPPPGPVVAIDIERWRTWP